MVALAVIPHIGPVGTKVEALSGTAWKHMMGRVQVDPQSLVLIWDVALATGTPLVDSSTVPSKGMVAGSVIPKVFNTTWSLPDIAKKTALLVK